ncbi:MAG: AmmeMemoRadiSam system protein B [Candidatus Zixiibacteriota bacterium]
MEKKLMDVRKPAVAGQFYPGEAGALVKTIAGFFSTAKKASLSGRPLALIAPHAGYPYSGKVAATAYKLLEGEAYDTVVIVSPSHMVFFKGSSVYVGDGYETPLGTVETDKELAQRIASIHPLVYASAQGHATGATRGEHSLEVHLPFLQVALGRFKMVGIVMGEQEEESIKALGEVLASALKERNCLMVASTDLSHFHSQKEANQLDGAVRKAIEAYDPDKLMRVLARGDGEACGGGPVAAVMTAAKRLGSRELKFLEYATSGETTGDFSEVVGYLSAVMVMGEKAQDVIADKQRVAAVMGAMAAKRPDARLTDDAKVELRRTAREAIAARLDGREYAPEPNEALEQKRGAFVTLGIDGRMRGHGGHVGAREPLYELIPKIALAAAFEDPTAEPLTSDEFARVEIEIAVLTPLERVKDFSEIKIGRDGLMVRLDMHSGLFMPQAAVENGWTVREFLEQTCLKASLPRESYKDKFAEVYRFSAEVF